MVHVLSFSFINEAEAVSLFEKSCPLFSDLIVSGNREMETYERLGNERILRDFRLSRP